MRQIGTLPNAEQTKRFVDFLLTQGISARADEEADNSWAIWIHDEEQLAQAANEFRSFQKQPDDARYLEIGGKAKGIRQREEQRRIAAAKNTVQMRGRWNQGIKRRAPATFLLIAAAVAVGLMTNFSFDRQSRTVNLLQFRDPTGLTISDMAQFDPWKDIRRGEVWRVFSSILLHGDHWHLFINVYWLWYFGSQIEDRRGTLRFVLLVLLSAAISNILQAVIDSPFGGGLSGVNYALFGYAWMKSRYEPKAGIVVSPTQTVFFIIWFFACFTGWFGPIANVAHGAGLFVGVVIGYLPLLFPRLEGKV